MALSDNLVKLLTRSPAEIAKEQLRKLYLRLYPYIIGDFAHKDDLKAAFLTVQAELIQIKALLQAHTHISASPGSPVSPTAVPVPPVAPSVIPNEVVARSWLVPGGIPQPIGGSISIQPSRVDPDPIAIPPINPLDPSA